MSITTLFVFPLFLSNLHLSFTHYILFALLLPLYFFTLFSSFFILLYSISIYLSVPSLYLLLSQVFLFSSYHICNIFLSFSSNNLKVSIPAFYFTPFSLPPFFPLPLNFLLFSFLSTLSLPSVCYEFI